MPLLLEQRNFLMTVGWLDKLDLIALKSEFALVCNELYVNEG